MAFRAFLVPEFDLFRIKQDVQAGLNDARDLI